MPIVEHNGKLVVRCVNHHLEKDASGTTFQRLDDLRPLTDWLFKGLHMQILRCSVCGYVELYAVKREEQ